MATVVGGRLLDVKGLVVFDDEGYWRGTIRDGDILSSDNRVVGRMYRDGSVFNYAGVEYRSPVECLAASTEARTSPAYNIGGPVFSGCLLHEAE